MRDLRYNAGLLNRHPFHAVEYSRRCHLSVPTRGTGRQPDLGTLKVNDTIKVGRFTSDPPYRDDEFHSEYVHCRRVEWLGDARRTDFTQDALYSIGPALTLSQPSTSTEQQVQRLLAGQQLEDLRETFITERSRAQVLPCAFPNQLGGGGGGLVRHEAQDDPLRVGRGADGQVREERALQDLHRGDVRVVDALMVSNQAVRPPGMMNHAAVVQHDALGEPESRQDRQKR